MYSFLSLISPVRNQKNCKPVYDFASIIFVDKICSLSKLDFGPSMWLILDLLEYQQLTTDSVLVLSSQRRNAKYLQSLRVSQKWQAYSWYSPPIRLYQLHLPAHVYDTTLRILSSFKPASFQYTSHHRHIGPHIPRIIHSTKDLVGELKKSRWSRYSRLDLLMTSPKTLHISSLCVEHVAMYPSGTRRWAMTLWLILPNHVASACHANRVGR